MSEPVWQSNYVDLCDQSTIRFGAECVICGARYVTPTETIAPELVASAIPGSALEQEIGDLKFQRFAEFDTAFRELSITCFRCGRAACPDCWDDDNRMCAECVMARGLTRSPRIGPPGRGPLQDGRLERFTAGKYSDVGQPEWLSQLLESEAAHPSFTPAPTPPDVSSPLAKSGATLRASSLVTALPFEPADYGSVTAQPTTRIPTSGPAPAGGAEPASWLMARQEEGNGSGARFETTEGSATSTMVTCPRCGTANYDFVTRCTVCQLQLIQICPACEKLNAGHAQNCEFCGASLARPQGWSGVHATIQPVPPDEVAQRRRSAPPHARNTSPRAASTGAPALDAAAFAAPATPAYGPFQAPPPRQPRERRSWNMIDITFYGVERLATFGLIAVVLIVIGGIVAAEVSPQADAFIAGFIHIDVHVLIEHLIQQIQHILSKL